MVHDIAADGEMDEQWSLKGEVKCVGGGRVNRCPNRCPERKEKSSSS